MLDDRLFFVLFSVGLTNSGVLDILNADPNNYLTHLFNIINTSPTLLPSFIEEDARPPKLLIFMEYEIKCYFLFKRLIKAIAPIFSLLAHKLQFKGANKKGIPVSRDPAALLAKYSDPLVYTGPIRARTGHEILRISSYLMRNFKSVTVPFFVLHGTADKVTDPVASQDFYNETSSNFKDIKLYEGFLHDLLFEPEREEIGQDIINWMEKRLGTVAEKIDHIL